MAGLVTSCVLVLYLFWPTVGCNLCEKLQIFVAASMAARHRGVWIKVPSGVSVRISARVLL